MMEAKTQLSVEEGNRLIAEFEGWKIEYRVRQNSVYPSLQVYEFNTINPSGKIVRSSRQHDNVKIEDGIQEEWNELLNYRAGRYHTSWDCLIPVWVRFRESVWKNFGGYHDEFHQWRQSFMRDVFNGNIASAQKTIAGAIQWYNTQTK